MKDLQNDVFDVDPEELDAEIAELADLAKTGVEATNTLRAAIKEVVETKGYNKQALAVIRKISAMSVEKRADFLRTFEPMLDAMIKLRWAQERRDLLDDLENAE